MSVQLTLEQQKLVSENHNLIYGFIHKNNLTVDDYYGVLAIGLCKAAIKYDSNKSSFSTHANWYFRHELYLARYHNNKEVNTVSCQDLVRDDDFSAEYNDDIWSKVLRKQRYLEENNVCDSVVFKVTIEDFKRSLSDNKQRVFNLFVDGLSYKEIADKLGISTSRVSQIVLSIRKEFKEFINKVGFF